jgi:hypothetical protein
MKNTPKLNKPSLDALFSFFKGEFLSYEFKAYNTVDNRRLAKEVAKESGHTLVITPKI